MTSLVQAEMINSSGVYVVGRLNREQDTMSEKEERLSLDHVVRLTVPPQKSEEKNAQDVVYSLGEIKDLQSKLMLIAGKAEKGKDEVDTFVKVRKISHLRWESVISGRIEWLLKFENVSAKSYKAKGLLPF